LSDSVFLSDSHLSDTDNDPFLTTSEPLISVR